MSGACTRLLLLLGFMGLATLATAQSKKAPAKFAGPGSSDAVSMGSKDGRAASRDRRYQPRPNAAVATYPGFRLLPDGRSRIYVELTKSVDVEERRAEGMLVYVIHDTRVPVRNNRNALITTHFATPVARARLLSAGSDVELIIDLRKAASATQKLVAGENGGARLEVDFPAGDYPLVPGLFEPPATKRRSQEGEDPEPSDQGAVPFASSPAASGDAQRVAPSPANAPHAAPTATSPPTH